MVQIYRESYPDATPSEIIKIPELEKKGLAENKSYMGEMNETTMVAVVLIATMAFQAVVSPPGGVWQDDSPPHHKAGEAVMASNRPKIFKSFKQANTVAFVSSLIAIFLLTSGLPFKYPKLLVVVIYTMWTSLAAVSVSYIASLMVITPNMETRSFSPIIKIVIAVFVSIYLSVFAGDLLIVLVMRIKSTKWWQEKFLRLEVN